jgi:hypothetical protein
VTRESKSALCAAKGVGDCGMNQGLACLFACLPVQPLELPLAELGMNDQGRPRCCIHGSGGEVRGGVVHD